MEEANDKKYQYNFLINASNQANLSDILAENSEQLPFQINSLFIFIDPYEIENFNIENQLNIHFDLDEKGSIWIDNQQFEFKEVKPGIKVFGIIKDNKE